MLTAILGRKVGMTQIFTETGNAIPVTVIEAGPCTVTQIKTVATDGYEAVQIGFGTKKLKNVTRPELGHLGHNLPQLEAQKKRRQEERSKTRQAARARGESGVAAEAAETDEGEEEQTTATTPTRGNDRRRGRAGGGLGPFQILREVEAQGEDDVTIGQVVGTDIFGVGDFVDVIGTSKGKGFQGVMKRHGFHGGQRTHGQSDRMRAPGSIGAGTTPGRVFKGTRMAGRMGNDRITIKALEVIQSDPERNLLVIKGSIPGANGGIVLIRKQKAGY